VPTGLASIADGSSIIFNSLALVEGGQSAHTIVRIRGMVHIEVAAATLAEVLMIYGVGIALFDDRAFAVASSAGVPRPLDDADDEKWMWYSTGYLGIGPGYSASTSDREESDGTGRIMSIDIPVDSKAMRVWHENQTLTWVCQAETVDGTATELDVCGFGRVLLKLA
jgi:hypothetical protein